jgi:restriction system protein
MKLEMHQNSLFAILLRSPWWISIAIAAGLAAASTFVVPLEYAVFVGLPFFVIGVVAAWRQLRAPSAARVVAALEATRAMSWPEFAGAMEEAFRRQGYRVDRLDGAKGDFALARGGRTALVSCKRWKVARTGVEPLRELDAARRAREASEGIYVAAGEITDQALEFAGRNGIRVVRGADLAALLPRRPAPRSPAA